MYNCTPLKPCSKCGKEYPFTSEYFYTDKQKPSGLRPECKVCNNAKKAQWREENPELVKANSKREYKSLRANPERLTRHNASIRRYYWRNAERKRAEWREYYQREIDYHKGRSKEWRKLNPDKAKAQWKRAQIKNGKAKQRSRDARKKNLPSDFKTVDWHYAIDFFHGCCAVCGRQAKDLFGERTIAADHWIPLSKGGGTIPENIIPLCHGLDGCNNTKSNKDPEQWLIERYGKKKAMQILAKVQAFFETVRKI